MNENEVVVVIPTYKEQLSETEKISLNQARTVLKDYPICFMAPEKMRSFLTSKGLKAEFFPDDNLNSRYAYSKLLLTPEFYQRFANYKYMLIYQLDAFVFYDKLKYFCSLDYDYIGAPMLNFAFSTIGRIGNGGLSLRKVLSFIRITREREQIYKQSNQRKYFEKIEDKFFAFCGKNVSIDFSVPNIKIANMFSIEHNISHVYSQLSKDNLPFGCHGWSRSRHFEVWRPYMIKYIKNLDKVEKEIYANGKDDYQTFVFYKLSQYLVRRIMRNSNVLASSILENYIPKDGKYVLWGKGAICDEAFMLFQYLERNIVCIFDKKTQENEIQHALPVIKPDIKLVIENEYKIIISTSLYAKEISKILEEDGLQKDKDFFVYEEVSAYLSKKYYEKILPNVVCDKL